MKQELPFDSEHRTPEENRRACEIALQAWTRNMLNGVVFPAGFWAYNGRRWLTPSDAIEGWKEALDYWESKCKSE